MNPISVVLTLWRAGSISDEEVDAWVSAELAKASVPAAELIDLAYYGPARCLRKSEADFPSRALELTYREEFTLWTLRLDFGDKADVRRFVNWVARISMGEGLGDELVKFGYYRDHLICDCNDEKAAIAYAKDNLPSLKPHFAQFAYELLAFVPELASTNDGRRVEKP